jgi:peptide/nickel transport system permease protein
VIRYILQRLVAVVAILAAISVLIFGITHLLPGNVAYIILGPFATPEQILALEERLHLHDPLPVQYLAWAGAVVQGDLGRSMIMERPIAPILLDAIGRSAVLAGLAFLLIATIGVGLGVLAAVRRGRLIDHGVSVFTYLGIAVPEFFWGVVIILVFAGTLRWLPATGYEPLSAGFWSWLGHMAAPVMTLTFAHLAHVSRLTRSSMLEALKAPYVTAARAKGVPERIVTLRHALLNAMLPTITVLALDIGRLMGGIVVVETVFSFPGLGRLLYFALTRHDIPLLEAGVLTVAAIYACANLGADLLYALLNPRIRYGRSLV